MKTAMQEAIELVKKYDNREIPMKVLFYNLEVLQEKEKEQIIDAHGTKGWYKPSDKTSGITTGEEYYNQTYNQNK
jgi:hypothetical protein